VQEIELQMMNSENIQKLNSITDADCGSVKPAFTANALLAEVEYAFQNLSLVNMAGEIWESCINYDGLYEVSNFGRVKSIFRIIVRSDGREMKIQERILKQAISKKKNKSKYLFVGLSKNGIIYTEEVHRLVGLSFKIKGIGENIIHINADKFDNRIINLKWATNNEKAKLSWDIGNNYSVNVGKFLGDSQSAKSILMLDMNGDKIKLFSCRKEAALWLIKNGFSKDQPLVNIMSAINRAANGVTKFSYGHKWSNLKLAE